MRMTKSTDHLRSGFTKLIQLSFLVLKMMMIQMHMNQHLTCAFVSSYSLQKIADLCTSSKYMSILEPSYTSDPHGNNINSNNSKETKDTTTTTRLPFPPLEKHLDVIYCRNHLQPQSLFLYLP